MPLLRRLRLETRSPLLKPAVTRLRSGISPMMSWRETGSVGGALRAEWSDDPRSWTPLADGIVTLLPVTVRDAKPPASGAR